MKVINMLNDLVNDRVVYPYIKYYNRSSKSYEIMLNCEENIINKLDQGNITLYDEIEGIVEHEEEPQEHKIPEKICTNRIINTKDILEFEMIQNKINAEYTYVINEILDYLEEIE